MQSIKVIFVNVASVQQVINALSSRLQFTRPPLVSAQVREKAECAAVYSHFPGDYFRVAALYIFLGRWKWNDSFFGVFWVFFKYSFKNRP